MPSPTSPLIANRYLIEAKLGEGGMGAVYRAYDRLSNHHVALKRVTVQTDQLIFNTRSESGDLRIALAREFRMLASLRHPNIVSVLDYGFDDDRQPFITMELLEDALNIRDFAGDASVDAQAEVLIQVLQALAYLHRRNILHRDLKPDNILTGNNRQIKILDFGLSVKRHETSDDDDENIVGTLAYMAPEILLGGKPQMASDLYAVGVIAYELFVGHHPFDHSNINEMIAQIAYGEPSYDEVDAALKPVLIRLLAKSPETRYTSAIDVIRDLSQAVGLTVSAETEAMRESFIQAAHFVGRETEFNTLYQAYQKIAQTAQGRVWLISGESGIGKSRLVEEVRSAMLVQGANVLRGHAVQDGGAPYQAWRNVLRMLSVQTPLNDLEARVLKTVIPDLAALLDREIEDAPALDPQATQERFARVVQNVFSRLNQPTVIILEDLHWASSESIALLRQLAGQIERLPVMVMGSYRSDEGFDLSATIPQVEILQLKRLSRSDIAELSISILGEDVQETQVIDFLTRETEGNLFFIVEVMRELAKDAGELSQIGVITLPASMFVGGIQKVIEQRLSRLADEYHPLLRLAAALGRQLDLKILEIFTTPEALTRWLQVCADAAILEVKEDTWQFSHDKIRETVMAQLMPEEVRTVYERGALATEHVYQDDRRYSTSLAHLWNKAENRAKEAHYTILAGEQALENGACTEAIQLLMTATKLGSTLGYTPEQQAHIARLIGTAYASLGQPNEVTAYAETVLRLLNHRIPRPGTSEMLQFARAAVIQFWHRLEMDGLKRRRQHLNNTYYSLDAIKACGLLAESYFYVDEEILSTYYSIHGLNLAERAGEPAQGELIKNYGNMVLAAGILGMQGLARRYMRHVDRLVEHSTFYDDCVRAFMVIGVYLIGRAEWDQCLVYLERIRALIAITVNQRQGDDLLSYDADIARFTGRWNESIEIYRQLYTSGKRRGDVQIQSWAISGQGENMLRLGRLEEAISPLQASLPLLIEINETSNVIRVRGLLVQVYLRLNDLENARRIMQELQPAVDATEPIAFWILEGFSGVAQYYLMMWEQQHDAESMKQATKACQRLVKFSGVFAIAAPIAWAYEAWHQWLKQDAKKAEQAFAKSVKRAHEHTMPHEAGVAYWHYARFLPDSDPQRREYLLKALANFEQLGAAWEQNAVAALLK